MKTASLISRFIEDRLLDGPSKGDPLAQGLLDSLAVEQLIAFIETRFAVDFTDDELIPENFASVPSLSDLVDAKRATS